jgi:hypothetical protein
MINKRRYCENCDQYSTEEGHDACIANLPGVIHACCGHGKEEGYVKLENGITIRGYFEHVGYGSLCHRDKVRVNNHRYNDLYRFWLTLRDAAREGELPGAVKEKIFDLSRMIVNEFSEELLRPPEGDE